MSATRRLPLALALLVLGCGGLFKSGANPTHCQSDSDCEADQVCFVDGCGDPGKDLAVEVTPSTLTGAYPQDFRIDKLEANQLLQLFAPSTVSGNVISTGASGSPSPYVGVVGFVLNGQSDLIPGVTRHFEASVTPDGEGHYAIPAGSGTYTLTATPAEARLPPRTFPDTTLQPGQGTQVDVPLPGLDALTQISGTLLPIPVPASTAPVMSVQAFDAEGQPLSQPVSVGTDGLFTLEIPSDAADFEVDLKVSPLDPGAVLPSETFSFTAPSQVTLDLGAFGDQLTAQGRVLDAEGKPVAGASIHLQGPVGGGGTFHSTAARSDDKGRFTLPTLASATGTPFELLIIPPPGVSAGLLDEQVSIAAGATDLGDLSCPDRLTVRGTLKLPDGSPAVGIQVEAVPLTPLFTDAPLPSDHTVATTDADAHFTLTLDPGNYRLDFEPAGKVPRMSRFVSADPDSATQGEIELPAYTLSKGRTVSGHVEILGSASTSPVPVAHVRFFRLVKDLDGEPSSVLLDQAYADANGNFTVLLPTR